MFSISWLIPPHWLLNPHSLNSELLSRESPPSPWSSFSGGWGQVLVLTQHWVTLPHPYGIRHEFLTGNPKQQQPGGGFKWYKGSMMEPRSLPPREMPSSQIPIRNLFPPPNAAEFTPPIGRVYARGIRILEHAGVGQNPRSSCIHGWKTADRPTWHQPW